MGVVGGLTLVDVLDALLVTLLEHNPGNALLQVRNGINFIIILTNLSAFDQYVEIFLTHFNYIINHFNYYLLTDCILIINYY